MAIYIDAEAFKRKLIDEKNFFPAIVSSALKEMPKEDVIEVKHGEWIEDCGSYDLRDHFYHCSKCGRPINVICGTQLSDYPYCSNCGAKMDGKRVE